MCGKEMENLGNMSGFYYTSSSIQWDTTYICGKCKVKRVIREFEIIKEKPDISDYEEI